MTSPACSVCETRTAAPRSSPASGRSAGPHQAQSATLDEVELSPTGKLWSYTTNHYEPPEPYVSADPFVPYTVCAVELRDEQMVVLGQLSEAADPADLQVGQEMSLVEEVLFVRRRPRVHGLALGARRGGVR